MVKVKGFLNKKRVVAVIIVFVVIAVMVFSNPEVQKFILKPDTVKLNLQTGINYSLQVAGKEMLLVSSDGIRAVDDGGRENWSIIAPTTFPVVITKNDYIMLADINGTTVNVYERDKIITQIKTEREILSAKLNKNGYVAVATDELGYKGVVRMFDKNGKDIFKWYSGTGYIGDIDIASKNKLAVAQIMTDKEQVYSRIMLIDTRSPEKANCIAELDGIVMKLNFKDNGGLVAVSEGGVYGFKRSGKKDFAVDFDGRVPVDCNIDTPGNMVFAFDSGLNNTVLESYSAKGKLRGKYEADSRITDFDVNGECIIAVTQKGVTRVTPSGKIKSETEISRDVKEIKLFAGRDKFLSLGGSSAEILKVN